MNKTAGRGRPRNFDRDAALDKAMNLFWRNGYEATSINDLTKAMEINPPSLYASFGNKEKLFIEAVDYYVKNFGNYRIEALKESLTAQEGIKNLLIRTIDQFYSKPDKTGCLVVSAALSGSSESKNVQDILSNERRKTVALIRARLEQGQKDGDVAESLNLDVLADYFGIILFGITVQAKDNVPIENLYDSVEMALKTLNN
ncbi:TetR/AcrR family transcriptional regulator [Acinetobacter nosocomialis]|uniref:TetR/AcrR family transcriptional regulator n=1 Tax=Acinetobacter nosocomialis TaxID=106654 RepID=UPI0008DE0010|nr:TetR/AcrR family transcriptional regulator [Acinetobacter nosocomialis]OIC73532.1 transcriptional regulator [Acinetobacter nosocomialis]